MAKYGRNTGIIVGGQPGTVAEWAKYNGVPVSTVVYRLKHGYSPEEAMTGVRTRKNKVAAKKPAQGRGDSRGAGDPKAVLSAMSVLLGIPMSEGDKIAAISLLLEKAGY